MKGTIILPSFYISRHSKQWIPELKDGKEDFSCVTSVKSPLFYAIKQAFGFDINYVDEVDVSSDTDIVIMFGVPYHDRPKLIPGLLDLNENIKLVMFTGDLQCYGSECLENKLKVFDRCDLIISGCYEYFVKTYPQFLSKYEFLPNFFAPHNRYAELPFNNYPKLRGLLSGASGPSIYPLRDVFRKSCFCGDEGKWIHHRPNRFAKGDDYAKLLNSYFCCVTSSSIYNYVVAKYLEIPAAGSLLLANETNDLKKLGFIPYKHYVPITNQNAIETTLHCIENYGAYSDIRKEGMEFVRKNHSINNRMEELGKIFDDLLI